MADYRKQAQQEYDVGYNQKVNALKNQLAENQLALEQQKGGINQSFDKQVQAQNLNNRLVKNNISDQMLGRGLGNSTIAVSGLAGADAKNTRLVGEINDKRTTALGNIDEQKATLNRNTNASLAQLAAQREDAIAALARQLEDRQWEKDYKNRQLSLQERIAKAEQAYRDAQLALQKEQMNKYSSYGGGYGRSYGGYNKGRSGGGKATSNDVIGVMRAIQTNPNASHAEKHQALSALNGKVAGSDMDRFTKDAVYYAQKSEQINMNKQAQASKPQEKKHWWQFWK